MDAEAIKSLMDGIITMAVDAKSSVDTGDTVAAEDAIQGIIQDAERVIEEILKDR